VVGLPDDELCRVGVEGIQRKRPAWAALRAGHAVDLGEVQQSPKEDGPACDAAKVQEAMVGPGVLHATRFPTVTFRSKDVRGKTTAPGAYDLNITGDLSLHGMTRSVALPLRVEVSADTLKASGRLVLRQTDYGISPVTVAGVVKVKDEITIEYAFVATKVIQ